MGQRTLKVAASQRIHVYHLCIALVFGDARPSLYAMLLHMCA